MKKSLKFIFLILIAIVLTACNKAGDTKDALKFKEEYEAYNDQSNDYFEYRNLSIDSSNPFIYSTDKEIVSKIENKESFIVYFGDPECPWCRSVIEEAIKIAKENNIDSIYYVRFWNGFHKETIRDVYELNSENKPVLKEKGSDAYYKLLEYLDNVLEDYTLKDDNGNIIDVNEKRIFLPNFVSIIDGEAKELIQGISEKQESYNASLTDEIINDEKKIFNDFFNKYSNQNYNKLCTNEEC